MFSNTSAGPPSSSDFAAMAPISWVRSTSAVMCFSIPAASRASRYSRISLYPPVLVLRSSVAAMIAPFSFCRRELRLHVPILGIPGGRGRYVLKPIRHHDGVDREVGAHHQIQVGLHID